ncbi:hypothetical protein GW17_00057603 [Ensete ventricosum]|nr:hypothetical protein GW17_00057603 [Ensete ventricosum]
MEVRSEQGFMASRDSSSFNIGLQTSPLQPQSLEMQSMRLAYTADGTAIYKPISSSSPVPQPPPTYLGGGGGSIATGDGSTASAAVSPHGLNINVGEPVKKKRGRPRKYGPDGLALTSLATAASVSSSSPPAGTGHLAPSGSADATKKPKGRPPGSSKKQQMGALEADACISLINVIVYIYMQGRFEILSLSGSFLLSESGGQRSRTGGLSVSLAGPDGRVLGGGVAGLLMAASPVQVVVGSFIPVVKKEPKQIDSIVQASAPAKPAPGRMTGASSPPSRGSLSESSGGPGSPLNQSSGACNNSNQHGLANILWK